MELTWRQAIKNKLVGNFLGGKCHITKHFRYLKRFGIRTPKRYKYGSFPTPQTSRKFPVRSETRTILGTWKVLVIICIGMFKASPLTIPRHPGEYRNWGEFGVWLVYFWGYSHTYVIPNFSRVALERLGSDRKNEPNTNLGKFWTTSWKINMVHLQITHKKKGKGSEPNLRDYVPC